MTSPLRTASRLAWSLSFCLALCACAGPIGKAPTPTQAPTTPFGGQARAATPAPAPTRTPVPTATAVPTRAPQGRPLKIGVLTDLSGDLRLFGNEVWNGLQIGLDYATGDGRAVADRPIQLIVRDDASHVEAALAAARELIETEQVELLIGGTASSVALQLQQIALEHDVLYFAAPAAAPEITGRNFNDHTFRVCRNGAQDGPALAAWALQNVGQRYLILAEDYPYGQAAAASLQAAFGAQGASLLTAQPVFAASDAADFSSMVQVVREQTPDGLILIWATSASARVLLQQLSEPGLPLLTVFSANELVRQMDPGFVGATGVSIYHYTLPRTAANDFLVARHRAVFGGAPDLFSECGFATAQAVVAALQATGGDTSPQAMIPALEGLAFEGPKGAYSVRPQDHQALAPLYVAKLVSTTDPDDRFFELVSEVSGEMSAPPCSAPGRCD